MVVLPGVAILEREEEREEMIEEDLPAETSNMRATTASLVLSATPWCTMWSSRG